MERRTFIAATHAFRLARGELVELDGTHNVELRVQHGKVWLTQEGDGRDYVIGPSEPFRIFANGPCLIQALGAAEISLRSAAQPTRTRCLWGVRVPHPST